MHIANELVVFFDVDDTLVMWDDEHAKDVYIDDPYDHSTLLLRRHLSHIKLLKDYKSRGYFIIVWSAGGAPWAKAVVDALELNDYVDITICKPIKFVDDLPAQEVLVNRVYLKENEKPEPT